MCWITRLAITWCLLVFAPARATCQLLLKTDLKGLCDRADAVVIGRVEGARKSGSSTMLISGTSYPADLMEAHVTADKVLKGRVKRGKVTVGFLLPNTLAMNISVGGVGAGQYRVLFLKNGAKGYDILDPEYPSVVAYPGAPDTQGSVLTQVTAEVCHVLESPGASDADKHQALLVLESVSSPAVTKALRTAARDRVLSVRYAAIALLLRRNDISELATAEKFLVDPPRNLDQNAVDRLAFAIRFGVHNPNAIPSLARLMLARNVSVRKGAATALRRCHDAAAIKPLARALEDSDPDVLYQAVIGLAELTHAEADWAPSEDLFRKDRMRYLDHWREWAKSKN